MEFTEDPLQNVNVLITQCLVKQILEQQLSWSGIFNRKF